MINKICGIYCILNTVNGKLYVGQSHNILKRWKTEVSGHRINNHLRAAFEKYGIEKFKFFILEECKSDELSNREKFYISLYKSFDRDFGYNKTLGGEGSVGYVPTEETRKKVSLANKGRKYTDKQLINVKKSARIKHENGVCGISVYCYETKKVYSSCALAADELGVRKETIRRCLKGLSYSSGGYHFCRVEDKDTFIPNYHPYKGKKGHKPSAYNLQRIREVNTGRKKSPEEIEKLRKANIGKTLSEETKQKIRDHARHSPLTEEHKKAISEANKRRVVEQNLGKRVYCFETDTVYNTIAEAARMNNIGDDTLVSRCCNGKLLSTNGLHFCFEQDKDTFKIKEPLHNGTVVKCIELDMTFESLNKAENFLRNKGYKVNKKGISLVCQGKQDKTGNLHFKFV